MDAVSEGGAFTVVVIILLGNPFSPRYANARAGRQKASACALDYCTLNVALYGPRRTWWCLTERKLAKDGRSASAIALGRSRAAWHADTLVFDIDEVTTPRRRALAGQITVSAEIETSLAVPLDKAGTHTWWPVAPRARVDVKMRSPDIQFSAQGYHDANAGDVPLEASFTGWNWARAAIAGRKTVVAYDVRERQGGETARTMVFDGGRVSEFEHATRVSLPATRWGLPRQTAADEGHRPRVVRPLEDGPFYARAAVSTRLFGEETLAMHEVLSARRLGRSWVRYLSGFRMAVDQ